MGGTIHQAVSYRKTDTDFSAQIRKLTGNRIDSQQQDNSAAEPLPVDQRWILKPSLFRIHISV